MRRYFKGSTTKWPTKGVGRCGDEEAEPAKEDDPEQDIREVGGEEHAKCFSVRPLAGSGD
ncbi:MAG: hypothetical protein JSS27_13285 [Planctomycetes bacterium]|nr:hypothetical protein [Planctomycetota bacterium]